MQEITLLNNYITHPKHKCLSLTLWCGGASQLVSEKNCEPRVLKQRLRSRLKLTSSAINKEKRLMSLEFGCLQNGNICSEND